MCLPKHQARCWGGHAGKTSLTSFQYLRHPRYGLISTANGNQTASDIAYHVVQKTVGRHFYDNQLSGAIDADRIHAAHRLSGLAARCPETTKIVLADQTLGGQVHALCIERLKHPGGLPGPKRWPNPAVINAIPVGSRNGSKSRVKVHWYLTRPEHSDVVRQTGVASQHPAAFASLRRGIKVHHLLMRMHSGIGAACTMHGYFVIGNA